MRNYRKAPAGDIDIYLIRIYGYVEGRRRSA